MVDYQPTFGGPGADGGSLGVDLGNANELGADANFLAGSVNSGGADSDRDSAGTGFDPDTHVGRDKLNADGTFRRKRGRRSGSGNSGSAGGRASGKRADNQANIDGFTAMLAMLHVGVATATKSPELILVDDEAEKLSRATINVLNEFDIAPDPKIAAVLGLVITASSIYGPKIYFIRERLKVERAARTN